MEIQNKPKSYKEGSVEDQTIVVEDEFVIEPVKGEKVNVIYWVRYPSYDFIFGVPDKSSPKFGKEVGFYQFRDTRNKKVEAGLYVDVQELNELLEGFKKMKEFAQENSKHLYG